MGHNITQQLRLQEFLEEFNDDQSKLWAKFNKALPLFTGESVTIPLDDVQTRFENAINSCAALYAIIKTSNIMATAAAVGDIVAMEACLRSTGGMTSPDRTMTIAAMNGQIAAMEKCRKWGATDINGAFASAAARGQDEAVRQLRLWGATDLDGAIACANGSLAREIVGWK